MQMTIILITNGLKIELIYASVRRINEESCGNEENTLSIYYKL